jgi:hypothetical protein
MLIGTRNDLLKFICKPQESEKDLRRPFKLKRVLTLPGRISKVQARKLYIGIQAGFHG